MNICFLMYHGSMYSGGQGIYLYYLTRELSRLGHRVHVIAGPPYPRLPEGVQMHPVDSVSFYRYLEDRRGFFARNPWEFFYPLNFLEFTSTRAGLFTLMISFSLRALAEFKRLSRHIPFDIIHDNQCLGPGLLFLKGTGIPVVATIHHPLSIDVRNAVAEARNPLLKARRLIYYPTLMQELVARRLDRVIAVSRASAEMVARTFKVPRERLRIVYNGVDTELFRPLPLEKRPGSLIYVGNSEDRNKGIRYLLKALHLLFPRVDYHLTFVDRPRGELKLAPRLVRRYKLSTRIDFTGRVPNQELVQLYCRSLVAICPSLYEGFGLPAAEAMACGVPVVATTGGALPEVVEDGVTGILVPPADAEALAEAIYRLLSDEPLRRRLGEMARQRVVERFHWRRTALETLAIYEEALSRQPSAQGLSR